MYTNKTKSIGYHTRLANNNTVKVVGGSFGGSIDMETVNRLMAHHFTVTVKDSGRAVFVDKEGREVQLYLTVDAELTEKGKTAMQAWRVKQAAKAERDQVQAEKEAAEVSQAMEGLSHDEIMDRLRRPAAEIR
jgi:NAD/NADP transhydrogenase alpha subunit